MLSMNEMTTYRWSFEEDVRHYMAAGYQALGVWRQKLADFGEEKGIELLRDNRMAVSSLLWAGGFTGSDGRTHRESVEDAREAVRRAGTMQAVCLVVYTGARGGHTHNHARRLIKSALTELEPAAAEAGVTLALEPMHAGCASEWTFLTSASDTLDLLEEVGSEHVKLVLDTYHLCQDSGGLDALPRLVPRTALVQLGDAKKPPLNEQNRCRLGEGTIPLSDIVAGLMQEGYDGYYEVELLGEDVEADDYEMLLNHSRQTCAELGLD
jgi:sugar phosphate isomerase/epimerase